MATVKSNPRYAKQQRESWLNVKYGITVEDYEQLLEKQNGVCGICSKSTDYYLCVDHQHDNGNIRGLLCRTCNKAIGQLGDTPESLRKALKYLETTHKSS